MFQKSDIQILIATMNRTNFDFLKAMFVFSNFSNFHILIVNQTSQEEQLVSDLENVQVVNSFNKGLSKSRNLALKNATKSLLLFTDDDVVFQSDFDTKIVAAFNTYTEYDGFRFQFLKSKKILAKPYPNVFKSHLTPFDVLNTSSVELVFKNKSLKMNHLQFDEYFGLGASFFMGEEAIFVADARAKGLNIGFVPEPILLHPGPTTGSKTDVSSIYFIQSAVFYRIFGKMYLFWIALKLFFDVKKRNINFTSVVQLFKQAIKGKQAYVNITRL
jgi:hypothetical protein